MQRHVLSLTVHLEHRLVSKCSSKERWFNELAPPSRLNFHRLLITICYLLFTVSCSLFPATAVAQQPVYIPPSAKVFSYPDDSVGIFGNMTNDGIFGSVPGSVVNFYGQSWINAATALLPGMDGIAGAPGGWFRFIGTKAQALYAGFNFNNKTGPSFPNLSVENTSGVWLQDLNDLHVRGNLNFNEGYLYLNGWNTLVNRSVTGYSDRGFVVTGGSIGGGSLYRDPPPADTLWVFPIGTQPGSYSPYAMQSSQSFGGIVGATVFDNVYLNAVTGNIMDSDYVMKTWQVTSGEGIPKTTVWLQHQMQDEGIRFGPYRDSSYVSLYQADNGAWDMDPLPHQVFSPGTLSTGHEHSDTYINGRRFFGGLPHQTVVQPGLDSVNWLTVSTSAFSNTTCPVADFKLWVAQRYDYKWVQLFWRTTRELNVEKYEVQRREDTAGSFHTIATITAKNVNGFSDHLLYYYYADSIIYDGSAYYRLKMTSASGCVVYTKLQKISWSAGVQVWPNPSPGPTHISILGIKHQVVMQVVDTWGQILNTYTVPPGVVYNIDLSKLQDAVYYLVFRDPARSNHEITAVKLVKITVR